MANWTATVTLRNTSHYFPARTVGVQGSRVSVAAHRALDAALKAIPPRTQIKGAVVKLERLAPVKPTTTLYTVVVTGTGPTDLREFEIRASSPDEARLMVERDLAGRYEWTSIEVQP